MLDTKSTQILCEAKASSLCSVPEAPGPEGEQIIKVHQADKKEGYSSQKEHRTWSQEMGRKEHGVCVESILICVNQRVLVERAC